MWWARRPLISFVGSMACLGAAYAQEPRAERIDAELIEPSSFSHVGLLRARDLTPFGLLRLDMLPARIADSEIGAWSVEVQFAYQNTFVMSENVRNYLESRPHKRAPLGAQDAAAILALRDDAYFVDGELGLTDLIVQRRTSEHWSIYATLPYIRYGEGVFDSLIEGFHDAVGFSQQGRDRVARNRFAIVYGVGEVEYSLLGRQVRGGFGDPVFGARYSLPRPQLGWDMVAELAAKIAIDGERPLLSTGRNDFGAQVTFQRRLGPGERHALYLGSSVVYYAGGPEGPTDETQLIPTVISGYSYGLTPWTSVILQAYASRSVVQESTVEELTANKYQLSLGLQGRGDAILWSFAVTENISNFGNTPDVGVQMGLAYLPKAR